MNRTRCSLDVIEMFSIEQFQQDGFTLVKGAIPQKDIQTLTEVVEQIKSESESAAGIRHLLTRSDFIRKFAKSSRLRNIAVNAVGKNARPVKAILFDKTPGSNWYVTWHQDVTIAVQERIESTGFGPWSIKEEVPHVQPPAAVLENMVSLRIHLDSCKEDNGAIKFIPGSHTKGIPEIEEIAELRDRGVAKVCEAESGEIIMMRPLILHSSSQSKRPEHRRVLHIEYTGRELPNGLKWAEGRGLDTVELVMAIEEEFV